MRDNKQQVLKISGLNCTGCAAEIEKEINNLHAVKAAKVDIATQKMFIEVTDGSSITEVLSRAAEIASAIEPDLKVAGHKYVQAGISFKHFEWFDHGLTFDMYKTIKIAGFYFGLFFFILAIFFSLTGSQKIVLYLGAYLLTGGEIVLKALRNTLKGRFFDENFLMFIATLGALAIGEYPEAVAVLIFYRIGEYFQDRVVQRSRRSISTLMNIRPEYANLLDKGSESIVSPEDVRPGQYIIVKPGEKVPLDGVVTEGSSFLNTSALTGEYIPRKAESGSSVLEGFINQNGLLTVRVTKEYGQSTGARILDLVENAAVNKARAETFMTKFARYYTPAIVLAAFFLTILPPLLIPGALISDWFYRSLIFLVVSCPCALVISIPLSYFGGIGSASSNGILVKGSNYLEALNSVKTAVFDKTGTLTEGVFEVVSIRPDPPFQENNLLEYAAFAESYSSHPIALSILKSYGREIDKNSITHYEEIAGYGVKAVIQNRLIIAGNTKLMEKENIGHKLSSQQDSGTLVHVAVDGEYAGSLTIADRIKEDILPALKGLKGMGISKLVMLTGDNHKAGNKTAQELGFDRVFTDLLPDQKVKIIEQLKTELNQREKLLFVGDGINDAPVLARADIGIAMGGLGSDAAIEAADIVLMTDEPAEILSAVQIARKTRTVVWQNIILALGVKLLILAMGTFGMATIWEAVFADVGVALIAILNAMRILNYQFFRKARSNSFMAYDRG